MPSTLQVRVLSKTLHSHRRAGCHTYAVSAGPCISTDTACSSSLVAAHLAHTGLLNEEADASVVGGINMMIDASTTFGICQLQVGAGSRHTALLPSLPAKDCKPWPLP